MRGVIIIAVGSINKILMFLEYLGTQLMPEIRAVTYRPDKCKNLIAKLTTLVGEMTGRTTKAETKCITVAFSLGKQGPRVEAVS